MAWERVVRSFLARLRAPTLFARNHPGSRGKGSWSIGPMADLNVFQFCKCLKQLGKVMVLMVVLFVGVSYYAVVGVTYGPWMLRGPPALSALSALAVITVTGCVVMILWSYFTAVLTDPGRVPTGWRPFLTAQEAEEELERINSRPYDPEARLAGLPRARFCRKCQAWKPERAHHDSVTGRCVLKMDHYCVWLINCVGLLNYKAFLTFLLWAFLGSALCALLLALSFVRLFREGAEAALANLTPVVFVAFVIDAAFALSLLGFLVMHANLVLRNCTTVEMYEKRRTTLWPYDHGYRRNFLEVFGNKPGRWLLPAYTAQEKEQLLNAALRMLSHSTELVEV